MPVNEYLTKIKSVSRQGYTGQEAIGGVSMGLIHMNGRVQDAITGRFLSPDPNIPDPTLTQSYNRYSYVNNNPLTYTDPSGFAACITVENLDGSPMIPGGGQCATFPVPIPPNVPRDTLPGAPISTPFTPASNPPPPATPPKPKTDDKPDKDKSNDSPQGSVDCNTGLPSGQTIGDVVRAQQAQLRGVFDSTLQTEGGPLFAELGTFAAIARPNGPIDFKNSFAGRASDQLLGDAGNFAFYAIGSGYIPDRVLDFGAGAYGLFAATARALRLSNQGPAYGDLTGPMFSDKSAASVRNVALNSSGCKKR